MKSSSLQQSEWFFSELEVNVSRNNSSLTDDRQDKDRKRKKESCSFEPCLIGCCIATLLVGIALAVVITLWLTSNAKGVGSNKTAVNSTTMTVQMVTTSNLTLISTSTSVSTSTTSTTSTTPTTSSTATTSTTSKTTTTTTMTTTTSVTTTVSTTTSATATTTSVGITTSTTSTTTTSATSTTTTGTTSTTTTSTTSTTSVTTVTITTTTTTTTTTAVFNSCLDLRWNQTAISSAGNGASSSSLSSFGNAACLYMDSSDVMYICDEMNQRVLRWVPNTSSGTVISQTSLTNAPSDIVFDKDGMMYVADRSLNHVVRYNGSVAVVVAGITNSGTTSLAHLDQPTGIDIDDDKNLYIAERNNERVVKWKPQVSPGTLLIAKSTNTKFFRIALALNSTASAYLGSQDDNRAFLWAFNRTSASITYTQVTGSSPSSIDKPHGIRLDLYGNLYVVDPNNRRVVMYCSNSTVGTVVINGASGGTSLDTPVDIAFDSNLNMYVIDQNLNRVYKYSRI